jgi:hypothetical protein
MDLGESWLDLLSGPMTAAVDGTRYELAPGASLTVPSTSTGPLSGSGSTATRAAPQ